MMKRTLTFFFVVLFFLPAFVNAQDPINAASIATFNAYRGSSPDSTIPYYKDLGVRRVIVADANGDGNQEIISTDYSNGGRVHVMQMTAENTLEIIWSSPISASSSGSTPRFPQVGDLDGDGMKEIIFEQNGLARIAVYEWDGTSWGTEPAFEINNTLFRGAGATEDLRYAREVLTVVDVDGDGKSELIPHAAGSSRNMYVIGVDGSFPGFASVIIEGGLGVNAGKWATGSFWTGLPADINGDGKYEIIGHNWDNYGIWAVVVNGIDSYTYPDSNNLAGTYNRYSPTDANSYFGLAAVDVDGDGDDEVAGTMYGNNFDMGLLNFNAWDTTNYLFHADSAATRFGIIATKANLAALANKTAAEFWPCVKGDLNQDGKEEIYTGGGRGLNLIATQYKGTGSVLDANNYVSNLVYKGEGGDVFATIKIYNGQIDTIITPRDTTADTTYVFDPSIIDTLYEETPFTSYIFADNVDLDKDGNFEIVLSEQSVYDSTTVIVYNWVDTTKSWERDLVASKKIINEYRKTVRVLENTATGLKDANYDIVTPDDYVLSQNFPNPFNPTTNIKFSLPVQKQISLKIYDMLGKEVATLINNQMYAKGNFELTWNGTNNIGSKVASGHYIATLTYGNFAKSIKMTLVK